MIRKAEWHNGVLCEPTQGENEWATGDRAVAVIITEVTAVILRWVVTGVDKLVRNGELVG